MGDEVQGNLKSWFHKSQEINIFQGKGSATPQTAAESKMRSGK